MQVHARVLNGTDIVAEEGVWIHKSETEVDTIGGFHIDRVPFFNATVEVERSLRLADSEGNGMWFHIVAEPPQETDQSRQVILQALPGQQIEDGLYKGQLTATVSYN